MDIHVYFHDSHEVVERLERMNDKLKIVLKQGDRIMALSKESQDLLKAIDEDTSAVAKRIDDLVANSSTTEAEFREALAPLAEHLDALGKTPVIPPLPPIE